MKKRWWKLLGVPCLALFGLTFQQAPASAALPELTCMQEAGGAPLGTCVANQGGYTWAAIRNIQPAGSGCILITGEVQLTYFPRVSFPLAPSR